MMYLLIFLCGIAVGMMVIPAIIILTPIKPPKCRERAAASPVQPATPPDRVPLSTATPAGPLSAHPAHRKC